MKRELIKTDRVTQSYPGLLTADWWPLKFLFAPASHVLNLPGIKELK